MRRRAATLVPLAACLAACAHGIAPPTAEETTRRHLIVDTHIDVPYRLQADWEDVTQRTERGDWDLSRALEGGLDVPFMSIYTPASMEEEGGAFQLANQLIDSVEALAARAPGQLGVARSVQDAERLVAEGLMALAMGMENGAPIEGKLENVGFFRDRGISYITLAHSLSNHISDSSYDENRPWQGLSDFGREVVVEMNRVGMMVDVSHLSDQAFYQVLETTEVPVIASHSSARRYTPDFERNMSDEMIVALAANGGVIHINFGSAFLTAEANAWAAMFWDLRAEFADEHGYAAGAEEVKEFTENYRQENPFPFAGLDQVLDHFDHVVQLVGVDHVGIGSDYDGVGDSLPEGLKDASQYPNLVAGLRGRGYSEADIGKILGGNLLRVWRQADAFSRR